ncbi:MULTISPECIES: hypothetical protein [Staphylococcus]|uniref:hypothetical protein n=1 Tax=Staphylococcus TaxID=1279 RepID=UPI0001EF5311|nr:MULTISPECIES: hypothetical protein [Staphylococcus]BBK28780.1 hypothetical protein SAP2_19640 [Staphylococcus arlettae]EFS19261.1 conserved hypothetical protein [Staphylococcus hominis subsp. hominis C80]MBF2137153.1 hypothetical protein [Staphylococcus epidermidis]MBF2164631.1 hypothetical protein [Staphylococcus epidermidis]MBF2166999.1 hypothetical protein [Staphylococcus epidermidis]
MGFIATIIVLVCSFYIFKNLFIILSNYVGEFVYSNNISRSEDGNQFIALVSTLVLTFLSLVLILVISYTIFKGFYLLPIIAISLYFKFGTDAGKQTD